MSRRHRHHRLSRQLQLAKEYGKHRPHLAKVLERNITTLLELREDLASTPRKLIFHDDGTNPMGVDQPGTLGVTFMIGKPEPAKEEAPTEPSTETAPAATP